MLYTKKGDAGTTSTFTGKISKSSVLSDALGSLDEVNSYIGLSKVTAFESGFRIRSSVPSTHLGSSHDRKRGVLFGAVLDEVQQNLFIIQAEVAGAPKHIRKSKVTKVEKVIAQIEADLPPIRTFSIPGGSELSARLDVARTIARRTERAVVAVAESGERTFGASTLAYMNRLSSLLFALARLANVRYGIKDSAPTYK